MGIISAVKNVVQMWRNFISTIQACFRSIYNCRIILVAILIMYIFYRFIPSMLVFIISCFPILVCTAVLLTTLLSFGSTSNNAQDEEKKTCEASSLTSQNVEKKGNIVPVQHRLRKRNNIRERALGRSGFLTTDRSLSRRQNRVVFPSLPPDDSNGKQVKIDEQPREILTPSSSFDMNDRSSADSDEGDTSTFCSDKAECSSPESPPTNVLPVIDEIDPLLETKPPQIPMTSPDEFGSGLECSDRSFDGSMDSEMDNQDGTQGNEEDGAKACIKWTEDDEKNLMDLGTSELERNKRLESLIARRRARKNKLLENNLIDFDSNDSHPIASITTKSNPFDLPYNQSDIDGLPPIPGSAPSVLVPRKNPFDLPYDPQEEKPNLTQDSFQQEFLSVFCRHESFSYGGSYMSSHNKQDKYNTKYTPYFATEGMSSGGTHDYFNPSGRSGERRSSIFGSLPDSESLPPIDKKHRKKQMDRVLSLGVYPYSYAEPERRIPEVSFTRTVQEVKRDTNDNNKVETKEVEEDLSSKDKKDEPEVNKESSSQEVEEENVESAPSVDSNNQESSTSKESSIPSEESDHKEAMEEVDDIHTKEPVYDSSPSAVEKRTIDEYLIYSDKGPTLTSSSSIASDLQVEVSELGSPQESLDRYPYTDGTSASRDNSVEEKEVRLVEETKNSNSSSVPSVNEKDQMKSSEPQASQPDLEVVDSMDPSSSSKIDKREQVPDEITTQTSSDGDHIEPPQEETLSSTQEAANTDNVEETKGDVSENNGVHETTEALKYMSKPTEDTMVDDEASKGHASEENNTDQKSSEAVP